MLEPYPKANDLDPVEYDECRRKDGRWLWSEWQENHTTETKTAEVVRNKTQLFEVDTTETDFLMGKVTECFHVLAARVEPISVT